MGFCVSVTNTLNTAVDSRHKWLCFVMKLYSQELSEDWIWPMVRNWPARQYVGGSSGKLLLCSRCKVLPLPHGT